MGGADVGVHVNSPEQIQGFVHRCRILEQVADGRCGGKGGLSAFLISLGVVTSHQVCDGQAILIDAVQGEEQYG